MRDRRSVLACILVLMPSWTLAQAVPHDGGAEAGEAKINVAVLLYDGALLLDYAIAAEMFLAADFMRAFNVYTVSRRAETALSILGKTHPDHTLATAPVPDVLIVPGGPLWSQEAEAAETVSYLHEVRDQGAILYSICTGSLLLAKAGFLEGRRATTNHQAVKMLETLSPSTTVVPQADYVDDGNLITTAGAGTAIEATLHLVERLTTPAIAKDLGSRYLDYPHMEK